MVVKNPPIEATRGFARNDKDEKRLRAAGVKKPIYRADKDEHPGKFKMRNGEYLGVVDGLRAFGESKRDIVWAVKLVHSWGATIVDVETGLCSRRDGAEMVMDAMAPVRPSEEYKKMQAKSARVRVKGRMSKHEALVIWRNPNLSVAEAIALMPKWSQATAYNQLGKRGVMPGRRPAKRETIEVIEPPEDFRPPSKRYKRGKIYFIHAGNGRVKIGFATNVKSRLSGLQTSHHNKLTLLYAMDGTTKTEKDFHDQFQEYRLTGEWFRLAGELRKFLISVKAL